MKCKISLFVIAVFCQINLFAQQVDFIKTYGVSGPASEGRDMISVPGGGVVIAATQSIGNHEDILLAKVAANGDTVWTKKFGTSADFRRAESVIRLTNGNLLVAGSVGFIGTAENALLMCLDPDGNLIWEKTYGGTGAEFANVVKEVNGDYILGGVTNSFGAGNFDAWLLRTNANGDSLWSKTFGGAEYDDCWDLELTPEGGFMLTGGNYSFASGQFDDAWLIKTTPDGDMIWRKNYGLTDRVDWSWALTPVSSGAVITGYVFVGVKNTEEDFPGLENGDLHFVKVDTAGNVIWDNSIDGTTTSLRKEGTDIKQLNDGSFIISGFQFTNTGEQLYIVMADANGVPVWDTSIGDNVGYSPWAATVADDGSCYITGGFRTVSMEIFLARITGLPTNVKHTSYEDKGIIIYPNPAVKHFFIKNTPGVIVNKVELYNVAGQVLQSVCNDKPEDVLIDVQAHNEAIFFVKVFTDRGIVTRTLYRAGLQR